MGTIHAEITWNLSDDGTLTISGTDMPDFYEFEAPWHSYSQRNKIRKVIIKDGVTNIGNYAFSLCSNMTSVTIPKSVTRIGYCAFKYCFCLISITIPNSVTSIKSNTFEGCSSLTSITIPNSVTSIEQWAFYDCESLTSIAIPNSVSNIGDMAFSGCEALTSITIPSSVTSIGNSAFSYCSGLISIKLEGGNMYYDSRNNCNAIIEKKSNTLIAGCKNTIIPSSVTSIGNHAFDGCSSLTSITIPNSVTSIGENAFSFSGLTSITIPNSVTSIGDYAFNGCKGLTSVTIPNSVTSIGGWAFSYCKDLTSITISNSVTSIGEGAFSSPNITSITSYASTPPIIVKNCFYYIDKSIPVYVPANSIDAYKVANEWKDFTNIQAIIDNQSIANAVINKINAIGKVEYTDACKDKIHDASTAYEALTEDQKTLVTNLDVLTTAKQTYDALKAAADKFAADKDKADAVIAKINAIGKVEYTYACKDKIDEANNAYNALTADQKALVTNLDVLTTAKQTYDILKAAADKLAADKAAFDKYKSEIIAIIESLLKEDDSDAVKEIINKAISEIEALKYEDAISLDDNKAKINSFVNSVDEAVEKQRAEDEKTNGIEELELAGKVNIYDLNGRKITNTMLKSGLYIKNGKKVVVK